MPAWTEWAGALKQCEDVPLVRGNLTLYEDGDLVDGPSCMLFKGDLPAFVSQYRRHPYRDGGPVLMVKRLTCTEHEDHIAVYFVCWREFMVAINNSTDPSDADFRFSQRVQFDPLWFWSSSTHAALPFAGRKRAVFLCLALKRLGLPSLCWMTVLRACVLDDFAPNGFYIAPVGPYDNVDELMAYEEHVLLSVETVVLQDRDYDGVAMEKLWRPDPALASVGTKRRLKDAGDVPAKRR